MDECSSDVNTEESTHIESTSDDNSTRQRSTRGAMVRARHKLAKWAKMLRGSPEDVENDD